MVHVALMLLSLSCSPSASTAQGVDTPTHGTTVTWRDLWRADRNSRLEANPRLAFVPTSLLVKFADRTMHDAARLDALKARAGVRLEPIEAWPLTPGLEHLMVEGDFETAMRTLRASPLVDFAEPDFVGSLEVVPNDPSFPLQWALRNTGQTVNGDRGTVNADTDADLAWDIVTGNEQLVVAVIDSGIRRTHQDLAQNIWQNPFEVQGDRIDNDADARIDDTWGWDFWNNDNDPSDDYGHGTHIAGIIGARGNNGVGIAGVCWRVKLAALKISNAQGNLTVSAAIGAIDYCASKRIRLSNHSYRMTETSNALDFAVAAAAFHRHLLVCAAGNGGADNLGDNNDTFPNYPASFPYDNIISVLATDNDDRRTRFSNYGLQSVDIGAPGMNIYSTWFSGSAAYRSLNGTSMATPHVTGACALVWTRYPTWNFREVRSRVLNTARPVTDLNGRCTSGGVLNIRAAVQ